MVRVAFILPLLLSSCFNDETISGYADRSAVYVLKELGGAPFTARATITFPDNGQVRGDGPCNGFNGRQNVPYPWIEISELVATRLACPELEQENLYFDALVSMTLAEVLGHALILSNDAGIEMVFRSDSQD